ncbi:MAG: hypothetical protein ACSHX6_02510 [Akkermansiaceae bacterium]
MFILKDTILGNTEATSSPSSSVRRFYRARNILPEEVLDWDNARSIPHDAPYWDDMFANSTRAGISAARQSLKPACFVWGVMAFIAVLYYAVPATQSFFTALDALQTKMGLFFPFLGMGLSVGFLAEAVKVVMSKEKRWTRANTGNAVFNLLMFGFLGVLQSYFYALQATLFGMGSSWKVLVPKVLFDQFVWTVFLANPYQTILYLWKNKGFSFKRVGEQMSPFRQFWGTQILPVLITNWAFWIPMVSIIYCFPGELQLPLAILAVTIWVLLLSILTTNEDEAA